MSNDTNNVSRREFVVKSAAVGAAALSASAILTSVARADEEKKSENGAGSKQGVLNVGFIGIGKMGDNHLNQFVGYKNVIVKAVADVDTTRREAARQKVDA